MIVDDHLVVREGLKKLLALEENIEVVAEASSGLECLQIIDQLTPDLIFMDVRMPGIDGIETTRRVCQKKPHVKVIMLTIYEDEEYVIEAIRSGAKGYVLKKVNREDLLKIINHVIENRAFLDPEMTAKFIDHVRQGDTFIKETGKAKLTKRELEVLQAIVSGYTDRIIAESLYISEHTVKSHIKNIYRKLKVSSRSQVVRKALQDEIITVGS